MARSKTISDERVLDILLETVMEVGPADLTFGRAGRACGLSPSTLVQRYGDREAMIRAVLLRAWDRLDEATAAADAAEPVTPEGAIDLLMRLMPPEHAERNATDGLLLLREDLRDPVLRARGAAWGYRLAEALGRRLSNDPAEAHRLGWQMACLWQGAHTWWAFIRHDTAEAAIRTLLRGWLDDRDI
ncbi:MAG: TetR/AcrR family transcriptional regulator [Alphaproteobacteria bacterium]|nr:TetR/AcrR family transcriptional regulator [Alphaproteobacteria bacterium]